MSGENRAKARRQQSKSKPSASRSATVSAPPKVKSGNSGGAATKTSPPRGASGGRSTNGVAWLIGGVVVAITVVVILVVTLSGGNDTSGNAARGAAAAAQGLHQTQPVKVTGKSLPGLEDTQDNGGNAVVPTLTGHTFDGSPSVAPVKGQPTMIVFGAHWCPHCQKEFPEIVDWMAAGGNKGVTVIAVPTGTNAQAPNYPPSSWLQRIGWKGEVLVDDKNSTAAQAYGLQAYPMIVYVGADGKVKMRTEGEVPTSTLDQGIKSITGT
jgi:thiol-disulfide isomerase/thioredoxin